MSMLIADRERKKKIADESAKTRRVRDKLKKQLEEYEQKTTPQAIEKKSIEIHRWIARHATDRIVLKDKNISLFDENQNAAKVSKKICEIAELLGK